MPGVDSRAFCRADAPRTGLRRSQPRVVPGPDGLGAGESPPCDVGDVTDHIEQIRHVAGVDHVGLGSDFDGVAAVPDGLEGVEGYPALLAELAARGWSDGELAKLTWHNALRVLRTTESVAAQARRMRGPSLATFAELDPRC